MWIGRKILHMKYNVYKQQSNAMKFHVRGSFKKYVDFCHN
jgi:hypothetical protein